MLSASPSLNDSFVFCQSVRNGTGHGKSRPDGLEEPAWKRELLGPPWSCAAGLSLELPAGEEVPAPRNKALNNRGCAPPFGISKR